jgi:RND family efflux transporter MFP subunit
MQHSRFSAAGLWLRKNIWAIVTLAVVWAVAALAVNHFRKPGQLTPIEAQAMDMSHMEPPAGAVPVATAKATRGTMRETVTYTGSVLPLNEEVITPRVEGRVASLSVYPGDTVRPGQVVARLDAGELGAKVAEAEADVEMARHGQMIAAQGAETAAAKAAAALAGRAGATQAVADAQAAFESAKSRQEAAVAERASAVQAADSARAALQSAQADAAYWRPEIQREKELLDVGAVSRQEYEQEKAQAAAAAAKVAQSASDLKKAEAGVQAADAGVRVASAGIASATAKVAGAKAGVQAAAAEARAAQSEAETARHEILHTGEGIRVAQARERGAAIEQGYTTVTSTLGGQVTARLVAPGTLVSPATPILKVADLRRVRLQANVAASDVGRISVGAPVTAYPQGDKGKAVAAKVTAVFPSAEAESRTAIVEAIVPNPGGRFQAGSYVVMAIAAGPRRETLTVPSSAVVQTTDGPAVWTMVSADGKTGTAHKVRVGTGGSDADRTEITSGLSEGAAVITQGQDDLIEGAAVQSVPWGPDGPQTLPQAGAGQSNRLSADSGWTAAQSADPLKGTLGIAPQPPSAEKANTLTLHLTEHGRPVSNASVTFRTDMPTMSMGGPTVAATRTGKGTYSASVPMMSTVWRVRADVTRDGGTKTLTFEVTIP